MTGPCILRKKEKTKNKDCHFWLWKPGRCTTGLNSHSHLTGPFVREAIKVQLGFITCHCIELWTSHLNSQLCFFCHLATFVSQIKNKMIIHNILFQLCQLVSPVNHSGSPQNDQTQSHANTHFKTSQIYHINPFLESVQKTNLYTNIKQSIYLQTSNTIFQRVSPFNTTPVKKAPKARTCWYCQPVSQIYQYLIKDNCKKGMNRNNKKIKNTI